MEVIANIVDLLTDILGLDSNTNGHCIAVCCRLLLMYAISLSVEVDQVQMPRKILRGLPPWPNVLANGTHNVRCVRSIIKMV